MKTSLTLRLPEELRIKIRKEAGHIEPFLTIAFDHSCVSVFTFLLFWNHKYPTVIITTHRIKIIYLFFISISAFPGRELMG